jgi:hypothetical protein
MTGPVQPERPDIAAELLTRMDADQRARTRRPLSWEEVGAVDSANTVFLKGIVAEHGWPGFALVGENAAFAAWLLAQHADRDPAFQNQARALLAAAVEARDADPQHLAYLTDRCLTGKGEPQVYGTQYTDSDGELRPYPIADPAYLDERRAAVGLEPHAEYDARMRSPST